MREGGRELEGGRWMCVLMEWGGGGGGEGVCPTYNVKGEEEQTLYAVMTCLQLRHG